MPAVSGTNGKNRRKRPSSLLAQASQLPSVESSLDDFIARANETLNDATFDAARNAEKELKQEDERRKEADALRWKATEQQMLETKAREESLRRQLDGMQGKLAEAEARAAVATSGGTQDGVIADLKVRLSAIEDAKRAAEDRSAQLAQELVLAKATAAAPAPAPAESLTYHDNEELEQRARIAEAKAAKALAAAKAAAAGLTVNPADIAAIESGLVVPVETSKKGTNWGLVFAALLVGGAIAAAAVFVVLNKKDTGKSSAAAAEQVQPAAGSLSAPAAPAAPAKPTVTPIEDTDSAPVAQPEGKVEEKVETAKGEDKVEEKELTIEAKGEDKIEEKVEAKAAPKKAAPAPKKAVAPKKAPKASKPTGALADPFGGGGDSAPAPAPKKAGKAKKPGGGGIVDPF
jgi:hypothetical protein